jgi:hypothetical protein
MLYVMRVVALPIVCQAKKSRSLLAALLLLCAIACARTGLYPGDLGDGEPIGNGSTNNGSATSAGGQTSSGGLIEVGGGGTPVILPNAGRPPIAVAGAPPKTVMDPPMCEPTPETCNGRDDDCNGAVDDLPPQACPGGGSRFCVAGRLSECPRRCDVCVPGSVRVCQNSFCSFWGEQECAADGQGFGHCAEANPPPECDAVAKKFKDSKQLEQCCIDNGYCCVDEHDLDQDGNRREMLGACSDIACQ